MTLRDLGLVPSAERRGRGLPTAVPSEREERVAMRQQIRDLEHRLSGFSQGHGFGEPGTEDAMDKGRRYALQFYGE